MHPAIITWVTDHWFLTFLLLYFSLGTIGKFFAIFHRAPRVVNQDELDQLREEITRDVTREMAAQSNIRQTQAIRNTTNTAATYPRQQEGKPLHERLDE